jgi:hypothetical protein
MQTTTNTKEVIYDPKNTEYHLNKDDMLIVYNSMHMYEPFCDYTFSDIPSCVIQSQKDRCPGQMEGASGSVTDTFSFTQAGTFTMTIIQMGYNYKYPNTQRNVKFIVTDSTKNKEMCKAL